MSRLHDSETTAARIDNARADYIRGFIGYCTLELLLTGYILDRFERKAVIDECVTIKHARVD